MVVVVHHYDRDLDDDTKHFCILLYHNPVKSPGNQGCLGCLLKVLPGRAVKVDPQSPGARGAWQAAGCGFTISDLEGT